MGKGKALPKETIVPIKMPYKLYSGLRWLATQKDSKGNKYTLDEIIVGACNLYLLGIQTYADKKKKDTKKMN